MPRFAVLPLRRPGPGAQGAARAPGSRDVTRRRSAHEVGFQARKRPRQPRSRATVEALVEATSRVLREGGYLGATTRRIAERAGVSVGSLYQYFPSRDALVTAVLERHVDEVLDAVLTILRRRARAPLAQAVRLVVLRVLELHERDHALHVVLMEQLPRADRSALFRKIDRVLGEALGAFLEAHPELPRTEPTHSIAVLGRACLPVIHVREQGLDVAPSRLADDLTRLIVGFLGGAAAG